MTIVEVGIGLSTVYCDNLERRGALRVNVMNKRQASPTPSRIIRVSASSLDDMCANRIFLLQHTIYISILSEQCVRTQYTPISIVLIYVIHMCI